MENILCVFLCLKKSYSQVHTLSTHGTSYTHSYYRTAKKIIRHLSNISFLRTCKSLNVIPNGLRAKNILENTNNCPAAKKLTQQHGRQWLQLAINTQYHRLYKTRQYVFPLIQHEDQEIVRFQNSLNETKQRKLQQLHQLLTSHNDSKTYRLKR